MNYRTLTDNKQVTELISAIKDLKQIIPTDKYNGSIDYIVNDNINYAKLISSYTIITPKQESYYRPLEFNDVLSVFYVLIFLMIIRYLSVTFSK